MDGKHEYAKHIKTIKKFSKRIIARSKKQLDYSFRSDKELLKVASSVFMLDKCQELEKNKRKPIEKLRKSSMKVLHCVLKHGGLSHTARAMTKHKLNRVEREILLLMLLSSTGMGNRIYDVEDLLLHLQPSKFESFTVFKALRPKGRLACSKLIEVKSADDMIDSSIAISGSFVASVLGQEKEKSTSFKGLQVPRTTLEQLALSKEVEDGMQLAIDSVHATPRLMNDWGLDDVVAYGRGMTMLFSGPPGVGKTACAEALANALGKKLLTVDYSELQNKWYGETEKRISQTLQDAAESKAVLFWDEADSMFHDREDEPQAWRVGIVNILLQEIERFEGVCVLSTNRTVAMDKALARRIAVKIKFKQPDQNQREKIWTKLMPEKLPLAEGVSLRQLAQWELSGGQIKNIVLNAARIAIRKSKAGYVEMEDFRTAKEMELGTFFTEENRGKIGFNQSGNRRKRQ